MALWHNFLFYALIRSNCEVVEFSAIEVQHLFPTQDGGLIKTFFDGIEKSTVCLRSCSSLQLSQAWKPSICDFAWKGSNTDGTASIAIAAYRLKFSPTASQTRRLTLVSDQTALVDSCAANLNLKMSSFLTQSRRSIFLNPYLESSTELKLMAVDEDRGVLFSDLPQDMVSQYQCEYYAGCSVYLEHFSNALVFRSKDSTTVDIWYPSGVSCMNGSNLNDVY